ncbi:reticulon-1-A isoform X12 [Oreochromis niloticus]|uniref:Reticulon n=1 Tax=Oreochromis niloticus TaxID=8128 RepID=I3KE27_ORENI|nr:reticulon-1-A isoform X12 [Oreochromis niloticus]XP_031615108.1 reticulon-1-A-like isoform X6 [Oreochromis aureus]
MADSEEHQVSSTTPMFNDEVHHYQAEPDHYLVDDDIVDLVGGAKDALERHRAEDSVPDDFTQTSLPDLKDTETVPLPEPALKPAVPDSTGPASAHEEPEVVAPKAEPARTKIAPEPEPAPESDALPAVEPREAAPSPAEAAERSAVTAEPAAPASLVDLLYWRDVKTTGVVFGAALLLLLSLTVCSIVSVCSYICLALLSVTICFRIYKGILQAIQKSDEGHPFKQYLDQEVALSEDMVHKYSDVVLAKLNKTIGELRRLFLVEDLVDSIKFAVLMWILTYVGALFNGLTLLILGVIAVFSCPIIYEKHQAQIDHYLALVNNQIKDVVGKIQAKVPGMKRKTE